MDLAYRSPFEGDTELICEALSDGMCLWIYQGVATAMPVMETHWTAGLRRWYIARRDANLMGMCPLCDAQIPPVMVGTKASAMRHDNDCALVAPAWISEFAAQA